MRTQWQGFYLDGRTATRHPATIRIWREGLELTTSGGARLWPYRDLRQTQGFYTGEEVRLERQAQPPEALVIPDSAFLESLREVAPDAASRFHDPRRRGARLRFTIAAALAVIAITGAIYVWGIPLLAAFVALRVPVAWEESLGQSAITHLAPIGQRCTDPKLEAAISEMVRRLAAAAPPSPYMLRVYVVDRPILNALAVPGGHVVVFRGLLERTGAPEEMAGVLAHELQHVLRRHTTRAVIQDASTGLLLMALTGDATGPLAYGIQAARTIGTLRYSRWAEEEADVEGMKMLLAARVDPAGMIAFFEMLQQEEGRVGAAPAYLSSHPPAADRLARLKAIAATWTGVPEPFPFAAKWPGLVKNC